MIVPWALPNRIGHRGAPRPGTLTEAIDRHRALTPAERVALAVQSSRAALCSPRPAVAPAMIAPAFNPDRVVAALNADDVAYVIVGGLALAAHGVVRATRDLDLVPAPDPENLRRLANTLTRLSDVRLSASARAATSRASSAQWHTRHGEVHVLYDML